MKKGFAVLCALLLLVTAAFAEGSWKCPECGKMVPELLGDVCPYCGGARHTHVWLPATCTEPETCRDCGETRGDPAGHAWQDATCMAPKTCAVCGATEGDVLPHSWDEGTVTLKADCHTEGILLKACTVCGETKEETLARDPKNHTGGTEIRDGKEATCTEDGYTGDTWCLGCGTLLEKGSKLAAAGHIWQEAAGNAVRSCRVCGAMEGEGLHIVQAEGLTGEFSVGVSLDEKGRVSGIALGETSSEVDAPFLQMVKENEGFLPQFIGKSGQIGEAEIDTVTYATVSSRAVLEAVNRILAGSAVKTERLTAEPAGEDVVILSVNGETVDRQTVTDRIEAYRQFNSFYSDMGLEPPYPTDPSGLLDTALSDLADELVARQKAAELGLDSFTEEELAQAQGGREGLLLERVKQYVRAGISVTEEDVRAAYEAKIEEEKRRYEAEPAAFGNDVNNGVLCCYAPAGYRYVKHILITGEDGEAANAETPPEKVREVYALVTADGADFDALMAEYGEDPGMMQEPGRTCGYAVCGESPFVEPYVRAALALKKVGDVSEPVPASPYGWFILRYEAEIQEGIRLTLEEARQALTESVLDARFNEVWRDTVDKWRSEADIRMWPERMGD